MNQRAGAHGARLQADIHDRAGQTVILQPQAGLAQGHDLGMGGGIMGRDRTIPALADHRVFIDNNGAHRDFTRTSRPPCQLKGALHPVNMIFHGIGVCALGARQCFGKTATLLQSGLPQQP